MNNTTRKNSNQQTVVLIAGATGYCGRHLVEECVQRGYTVKALVRRAPTPAFPSSVETVMGEATRPETLQGVMTNVDVVISALGITRQRDGLTYRDVDYQGNLNLLRQAEQSNVQQFVYIHVLKGEELSKVSVAIAAKQDFVEELKASKKVALKCVIGPSGFFSDMQDFLDMSASGRVYLFGSGQFKLNPIHGADLAAATLDIVQEQQQEQQQQQSHFVLKEVGGPDVLTHEELATLAFHVRKKSVRITFVWDWIRKVVQAVLPWATPISVYGPAQFFLEAFGMDMVGECHGTHRLEEFWKEVVAEEKS